MVSFSTVNRNFRITIGMQVGNIVPGRVENGIANLAVVDLDSLCQGTSSAESAVEFFADRFVSSVPPW
jgi:hypothetical protein